MTRTLWFLGAFALFAAAACTSVAPPGRSFVTVAGSGTIATEVRPVSGFSEVFVNGVGEVVIRQDGTETLSIEAEDNLLPYLKSTLNGRLLSLGPEAGVLVYPTRPIHYTLTVRQLSAIRMNGAGSVRAEGVKTELLQITLNGGARVNLAGVATRQDVLIAGAADYRGEGLASGEAEVEINGAGTTVLNASERLDATINGAGTVEYVGSPRVTQTINGLGVVRRRS
jgi:hypothetical protein